MKNIATLLFMFATCIGIHAQTDTLREKDGDYVVPTPVQAELDLIEPAEGFVVGQGFAGYMHYQTQASVVMTMINDINYVNIKQSMTDEYYRDNNMTKSGEFSIECASGLKGYGFQATFQLDGRTMVRQMVFIGDANKTLWLNTTVPAEYYELVSEDLKKMYRSTNFKR